LHVLADGVAEGGDEQVTDTTPPIVLCCVISCSFVLCYVTRMLQRCYKDGVAEGGDEQVTDATPRVTRVLQGYYKDVTKMLQGCYKSVTRMRLRRK
jgi:hypothetical protein